MISYDVRVWGMMFDVTPSDGSLMALGSTEPHAVRAKLMNPHQGLTQTTEYRGLGNAYNKT